MKGDTEVPGIDGLPGTQNSKGDKGNVSPQGLKASKATLVDQVLRRYG